MAVNSNDRYDAAVVVSWLRRCQEDGEFADECYKCPFSGKRCISHLQNLAADLIEKFMAALQSDAGDAEGMPSSVTAEQNGDPTKPALWGRGDGKILSEFSACGKSSVISCTSTWLRKCGTKDRTCKTCVGCPFDDEEHNCMDWMHTQAADLLERLARESRR